MNALYEWLVGLIALVLPGFADVPPEDLYFGYVEGEYVYISAREPGTVTTVTVSDGDPVEQGALLAELDSDRHRQMLRAAEARLSAAKANLRDMNKGSRNEEIAVVEARLRAAQSDRDLARENLTRTEALIERRLAPDSQGDRDRAALQAAEAAVTRLQAELVVARLPRREAQREAAEQEMQVAAADLQNKKTDLADRQIRAPVSGRVERVLLREGERAKAGSAVLSLLPPNGIKVRFYVPEPKRAVIQVGDPVLVGCTGCGQPVAASVSFVASDAEFTPPVIYSLEERARLVFLVEARFSNKTVLSPGQPVEIRPGP